MIWGYHYFWKHPSKTLLNWKDPKGASKICYEWKIWFYDFYATSGPNFIHNKTLHVSGTNLEAWTCVYEVYPVLGVTAPVHLRVCVPPRSYPMANRAIPLLPIPTWPSVLVVLASLWWFVASGRPSSCPNLTSLPEIDCRLKRFWW